MADLSPTLVAVLNAFRGGVCSRDDVVRRTRLSVESVDTALTELVSSGYLKRQARTRFESLDSPSTGHDEPRVSWRSWRETRHIYCVTCGRPAWADDNFELLIWPTLETLEDEYPEFDGSESRLSNGLPTHAQCALCRGSWPRIRCRRCGTRGEVMSVFRSRSRGVARRAILWAITPDGDGPHYEEWPKRILPSLCICCAPGSVTGDPSDQ